MSETIEWRVVWPDGFKGRAESLEGARRDAKAFADKHGTARIERRVVTTGPWESWEPVPE